MSRKLRRKIRRDSEELTESLAEFILSPPPKLTILSPQLFRLNYSGKTSLLLGTKHCVPLASFTKPVLNYIMGASCLLSEAQLEKEIDTPTDPTAPSVTRSIKTESKLASFYLELRSESDPDWYSGLELEFKQLLRKAFNTLHSLIPKFFAGITHIKQLKASAALALYIQYYMRSYGMDFQLIKRFTDSGGSVYALEKEDDVIPAMNDRKSLIENLIISEGFSTTFKICHAELSGTSEVAQEYLLDGQKDHVADDSMPVNSSDIIRNKKWLPKMIDYHLKYSNLLIACGAGHLYGPGFIITELEEKNDFLIERSNALGEFILTRFSMASLVMQNTSLGTESNPEAITAHHSSILDDARVSKECSDANDSSIPLLFSMKYKIGKPHPITIILDYVVGEKNKKSRM